MAGPIHAVTPARSSNSAAALGTTPPAMPRQPAWAATRRSSEASTIGRQSATSTATGTPDAEVARMSAGPSASAGSSNPAPAASSGTRTRPVPSARRSGRSARPGVLQGMGGDGESLRSRRGKGASFRPSPPPRLARARRAPLFQEVGDVQVVLAVAERTGAGRRRCRLELVVLLGVAQQRGDRDVLFPLGFLFHLPRSLGQQRRAELLAHLPVETRRDHRDPHLLAPPL